MDIPKNTLNAILDIAIIRKCPECTALADELIRHDALHALSKQIQAD